MTGWGLSRAECGLQLQPRKACLLSPRSRPDPSQASLHTCWQPVTPTRATGVSAGVTGRPSEATLCSVWGL